MGNELQGKVDSNIVLSEPVRIDPDQRILVLKPTAKVVD